MRLIDADELKKKIKLWAFNNVTTTPSTFDFVTEFDIDECTTVDVLEQIRAEIEHLDYLNIEDGSDGYDKYIEQYEVLKIIDKYRGDKE